MDTLPAASRLRSGSEYSSKIFEDFTENIYKHFISKVADEIESVIKVDPVTQAFGCLDVRKFPNLLYSVCFIKSESRGLVLLSYLMFLYLSVVQKNNYYSLRRPSFNRRLLLNVSDLIACVKSGEACSSPP